MASNTADTLFLGVEKLGYKMSHEDQEWEYSEEPHVTRRREILKKYPQIKKLMGPNPQITYVVIGEFILQMLICYGISVYNPSWGLLFLLAYVFGATINHSLQTAVHEISHNLAFGHKHPNWNRALGFFANLCLIVPASASFKKYHMDHHKYLGHERLDVDVPSQIEAYLFQKWWNKCLWLILNPVIYASRPFFKSPKPITKAEAVNVIIQVLFDVAFYYVFGWKAFVYLALGFILGNGLHPATAHFISEHYIHTKNQAAQSYYGIMNTVMFNVGYHVEHHDFPYIAYNKLPEVKRIAAEYYDNLPYHTSWVKVLWDFIFNAEYGPHARAVGYKEKVIKEHKDLVQKQKMEISKEQEGECLCSHVDSNKGVSNGSSNPLSDGLSNRLKNGTK